MDDRYPKLKRDMGLLPPAPEQAEEALRVLEGGGEVQDAEIGEEERG